MPRESSKAGTGSLTARVTERLRRAILDAEFGLGEALSEDKLAAALGVSRTPVRDSLTALQIQGLIDIKPQRGSFVFLPTAQDVAELCEIRSILEVQALRLSVARHKEAALERLRKGVEDMEAARAAGDYLAVAHADTDFHAALVENSGNRYLVESYRLASGQVVALRSHVLLAEGNIRTQAVLEHKAIIAAIENGNLTEAESILGMHISKAIESYNLALREDFLSRSYPKRREQSIDLSFDTQ